LRWVPFIGQFRLLTSLNPGGRNRVRSQCRPDGEFCLSVDWRGFPCVIPEPRIAFLRRYYRSSIVIIRGSRSPFRRKDPWFSMGWRLAHPTDPLGNTPDDLLRATAWVLVVAGWFAWAAMDRTTWDSVCLTVQRRYIGVTGILADLGASVERLWRIYEQEASRSLK
jgi:hypothetical protein